MKRIQLIFLTIFIISNSLIFGQSGAKYSTGGNETAPGDILGTTNNQPLNFVTNNILRMVLDVNGQLKVVNLAGSGSRFLQSDANGNLISFPAGNSSDVLYGNGVWGSLPAGATSWQMAGNNLLATNSGNIGIGTNSPIYKLDVVGDVRVSNNLYVGGGIVITDKVNAAHEVKTMSMRADSIVMDATKAIYGATRIEGDIDAKSKLNVIGNATFNGALRNITLSGMSDRIVYVDHNGNFKVGPGSTPPGISGPCVSNATPWYEGGNANTANNDIGTCDNSDFVLKSFNNSLIWLKPTAKIGFGTANPVEKFHFAGGDVRIDANVGIGTVSSVFRKLMVNGDVSFAGSNTDAFEILGGNQIPIRRGISIDNGFQGNVNFFVHSGLANSAFNFKNGASGNTLFKIRVNGQVQVGSKTSVSHPTAEFMVHGTIVSKELYVTKPADWPDYVFKSTYQLLPLSEVECFYKRESHLPGVPSEKELIQNDLSVGEMSAILLKKIEELTLYSVELNKELQDVKAELKQIKNKK